MTDESTPSVADLRAHFEAEIAPLLMQRTLGVLSGWRTPKLSKRVSFFRDDHTLAVVAHPNNDRGNAETALAWGLAYAGDRDLTLILPDGAEPRICRLLPRGSGRSTRLTTWFPGCCTPDWPTRPRYGRQPPRDNSSGS